MTGTGREPLSFPQQRLWFLDQFTPGSALYNIPIVLDLEGPLELTALERALESILHRHDTLRTCFPSVEGEPTQRIQPAGPFRLPLEDLSALPDAERQVRIERRIAEESERPFDLTTGPVSRAVLVRLAATRHVLIAVVHHIVFDAWSAGVFFRELATTYQAFAAGETSPLAALPFQYVEFSKRQQEWLAGDAPKKQLAYWMEHLKAPRPLLDLPLDHPRPPAQSYRGAREQLAIGQDLVRAIDEMSRREGVTTFITLLAAYAVLLYRYTGQDDLLIGTPIANRTRQELEPLIGFFANTLALRLSVSASPTFRALLGRAKRTAFGAYAHQDLPFETLVEAINPERSLSHSPILQTLLVFDNTPFAMAGGMNIGDLKITRRQIFTKTSKFDTSIMIAPAATGWRATIEYSTDLFDPETAARMLRHYVRLLEAVVQNPADSVDRLALMPEPERHQVVVDWNDTARPYPQGETLVTLFEKRVAAAPEAPALICGEDRLTYASLNMQADRFAARLRAAGVKPDDRIAICLERSPALIIGILAILKAGAAYVPLDPRYPKERLTFVAEDSQAKILVAESALESSLPTGAWTTIFMDRPDDSPERAVAPGEAAGPQHLAYVIYTSGSTGRPKGVAIEHRQAANLVTFALETFTQEELAAVLASTSVSFDVSVFELFATLSGGGTVVLVDNVLDAPRLDGTPVTLVSTVPSVMAELLRAGGLPATVQVVALAGEPLGQELVDQLYASTSVRKVIDFYGPTEATVYATWAVRNLRGRATIGRPIANTTAFVLNASLEPLPIGVPGELYLGGAGVARGYLGRPDLTAERFVRDPFSNRPSARLYRTGDRVRWLPDGVLEFLGRIDGQIKLRGFRIELGEIESVLRDLPGIHDAVVIKRDEPSGDTRLIAYVVHAGALGDAQLRDHLARQLPHYMIPAAYVRLDEVPRLPNGKLDRAALPVLGKPQPTPGHQGATALSPTEKALAGIWAKLLDLPAVGPDEDFFALGGHSLLAVRLFSEIGARFGTKLPLSSLFENGTIREQARLIAEGRAADVWSPIVAIQPNGTRPPFFLVHGIGGEVISFDALARNLHDEQPIFGLQADTRNGAAFFSSVEEVAAKYVWHLRTNRPTGPYKLGGYSSGGVIAFEMAQQLLASGEEVSALVMLDSPVPGASHRPLTVASAWDAVKNGIAWLVDDDFISMKGEDRYRRLANKVKAVYASRNGTGQGGADVRALLGAWKMPEEAREYLEAHYRMVRAYRPSPYPGAITVLRARTLGLGSRASSDLGWQRFASLGVRVRKVPGAHDTILKEPRVRVLAAALEDTLLKDN